MKYEVMETIILYTTICNLELEIGRAIGLNDMDKYDALHKELELAQIEMIHRFSLTNIFVCVMIFL